MTNFPFPSDCGFEIYHLYEIRGTGCNAMLSDQISEENKTKHVHTAQQQNFSSLCQSPWHSINTTWGQDKMAAIIPDNIFTCVFLNENAWISIKISLKFVPKDPMNNIPALVIDGLVQERHNSSASAMELRLSCINPSICTTRFHWVNRYWGQLNTVVVHGFRTFTQCPSNSVLFIHNIGWTWRSAL